MPVNLDSSTDQRRISKSGATRILEPSAPPSTLTDESVPGFEHSLIIRDGNASKERNPKHTFEQAGAYELKVRISKYGISLLTETISISVWDEGINPESEEAAERLLHISMYLNPASNFVALSIDHETERIAEVRIFDLRGRLVNIYGPADEVSSKAYEIPVIDVAAGVYFVSTVTQTGARDMQRLIVVH